LEWQSKAKLSWFANKNSHGISNAGTSLGENIREEVSEAETLH
jgi:hypothetical protein